MSGYPHTELVSAFDSLSDALYRLADRLRHSDLPLWVPLSDQELNAGIDARQKAISLYCELWYQGDGDGRRTASRHGLVAVDPATLVLAQQVNQAKQHFQAAVRPFQGQSDWRNALKGRGEALQQALASKGLSRLHLKQCYRQLPLVERCPQRAGFNWYSSGRSIKRLNVEQVNRRLIALGVDKPHIQRQLELLGNLAPNTPLAQVQTQAPLMRCNLRFATLPDRQAMNLSLPLLFPYVPGDSFPDYNTPPLAAPTGRQRQVRSDCRLEDTPFLPSLRIHRYRSAT